MSHVDTHCGGVGELETDEPAEIQVTVKNHTRLNFAAALKRWPNEPEVSWTKRQEKFAKLRHKMYELAAMPGDQFYYHQPSYIHPEP